MTCPTCGGPDRKRSARSHRFVFQAIARALENWPHTMKFQPRSENHLRAYLLLRVGHYHESELPIGSMHPEAAAELILAFVRKVNVHATAVKRGKRVIAIWPRSMSYQELGKAEFDRLSDKICGEIEAIVGIDCQTLVKGSEEAA